jgi:hypothetical protein
MGLGGAAVLVFFCCAANASALTSIKRDRKQKKTLRGRPMATTPLAISCHAKAREGKAQNRTSLSEG